jgi:hypothetical protein
MEAGLAGSRRAGPRRRRESTYTIHEAWVEARRRGSAYSTLRPCIRPARPARTRRVCGARVQACRPGEWAKSDSRDHAAWSVRGRCRIGLSAAAACSRGRVRGERQRACAGRIGARGRMYARVRHRRTCGGNAWSSKAYINTLSNESRGRGRGLPGPVARREGVENACGMHDPVAHRCPVAPGDGRSARTGGRRR